MQKLLLILLLLFLFSCSSTPKIYYFSCNEQSPEIIYSYFPQALNSIGYDVDKIITDSNIIIASKPILATNTKKGVETQFIQIKFRFVFDADTIKSEITQNYIVKINEKEKISLLNEKQIGTYEKDIITLQEKLLFYCNPQFKGR